LRPSLEHALIALAAACSAAALAFFVGAPAPSRFPDLAGFWYAFAAADRRAAIFLFPLGAATAALTILTLLRHGRLLSGRGRLQGVALVALFASAFASTAFSEPLRHAISIAVSHGTRAEVDALYARWWRMQSVGFGCTLAAAASLVLAQRLPVPAAPATAALTARHRRLLFLVGAASLFEGYDRFIAALALPYIGHDLGAGEGTLGFALSAIRAGSLLSIVFGRIADLRGRRGLLLFTVVAYTLATACTGLSRGMGTFIAFQLLAMIFLTTELAVAQVVITEEFPATYRAMGQGLLGAFGALGAGLAAMLFPMLQETRLGWRGLYFVGIVPLLLIAYMRRELPETARWQQARAEGETSESRFHLLLSPPLRRRFFVLIAVSVATWSAASPAFAFAAYRAKTDFGWSPAQVSTMIILGGGLGMGGWFVFGGLAERFGRRPVGLAAVTGVGVATSLYFWTSWLMLAFALLVAMEAGTSVAVNTLGTELFPTRTRSTAKAWIVNASIVGALLGLAIVGTFAERAGGASHVIVALALAPVFAAPLLLLVPEPRGRELEDLTA